MKYLEYLRTLIAGSMGSATSVVIYIAIIALFILGLARCVTPVLHNRNLLRKAIRSIRDNVGDDKYAWQEDAFLGKGALFAHWSDYLNNLFFADGRYHNASNVEDYINEETVIYGPGRISFAEALPGLLTSLGFLGTLIGLAAGLSGFSMTDSAAVQSSIVTLIPGMRYAFMTSIFGVVGSVLFTLITRAVYGSTEHAITQFYAAMSRHAGVLSVDPMTQIAIYQQEQTALIKTMTRDINGTFTQTMSSAITESMKPVNDTMKGFVNGITREQVRLIDAVLDRFIVRMDESLDGSLQRFSKTLDQTSRLQQQSNEAVRQSLSGTAELMGGLDELRRVVRTLLEGTSRYVEQLNAAQKRSDENTLRLIAAVEKLEQIARQENAYLRDLNAMQAELETLANRFADDTGRAAADMTKAANTLAAAGDHMAAAHADAARAINSELSSTLDAYNDYVNQFTQRVDYLSNGILGALEHMPDSVNDTGNRFLDQIDALADALEQAQRAIDAAVDRMYRNQ